MDRFRTFPQRNGLWGVVDEKHGDWPVRDKTHTAAAQIADAANGRSESPPTEYDEVGRVLRDHK